MRRRGTTARTAVPIEEPAMTFEDLREMRARAADPGT
jgi:hypothetical protein